MGTEEGGMIMYIETDSNGKIIIQDISQEEAVCIVRKFASELVFTCPINITNEFAGMIDYGFYVHLIGLDKLLDLAIKMCNHAMEILGGKKKDE